MRAIKFPFDLPFDLHFILPINYEAIDLPFDLHFELPPALAGG